MAFRRITDIHSSLRICRDSHIVTWFPHCHVIPTLSRDSHIVTWLTHCHVIHTLPRDLYIVTWFKHCHVIQTLSRSRANLPCDLDTFITWLRNRDVNQIFATRLRHLHDSKQAWPIFRCWPRDLQVARDLNVRHAISSLFNIRIHAVLHWFRRFELWFNNHCKKSLKQINLITPLHNYLTTVLTLYYSSQYNFYIRPIIWASLNL